VQHRLAITGIFALNGAVFSAWYARLPAIQDGLGLTPGQIGIALLGAPLGLLLAQPATGAIVARRGSRPLVAAAPLYLLACVLPRSPSTCRRSCSRSSSPAPPTACWTSR